MSDPNIEMIEPGVYAVDVPPMWPEIQPIVQQIKAVIPFDAALLPEPFAPWVCDAAERMQCPSDYMAVAAMVSLSAVIGRKGMVSGRANSTIGRYPGVQCLARIKQHFPRIGKTDFRV
jgi:hypothetical protein